MAPALFNWIKFRVKLREEENGETTLLAANLECGFNSGKVGLIEEEATAAAVDSILRALEILTLRIEACLLKKNLAP